MEWIKGGLCVPKGFRVSGVRSGIKKYARDLGLLYSQRPAAAAGIFTENRIQAAPVQVTRRHLKGGVLQAIIANSGNANCCTGARGLQDAERLAAVTAASLGIPDRSVAVCSTGVIGVSLPMGRIVRKIPALVSDLSRKAHLEFAESILTTDKKIKEAAVRCSVAGKSVAIGAVCKGAGMIHPRMATMLCFIATDAAVERKVLQPLLREVGEATFNRITVDGDMSTNDTVLVLANGLAGNRPVASAKAAAGFEKSLFAVMDDLAKRIVADGEGATRVAQVTVAGARSEREALQVCRSVANSNLVKTALFGRDANWGRIAASVGASGADVSERRLSIALGGIWLFRKGSPLSPNLGRVQKAFQKSPVPIQIELGQGRAQASMTTCDLTDEYVRINAHYRT